MPTVPLRLVEDDDADTDTDTGEQQRLLGEEMRELRKFVGLSQMQLASLCKVDITTISRWERGRWERGRMQHQVSRNVALAMEALRIAAELQRTEPARRFSAVEMQDYIDERKQERSLLAEYKRSLREKARLRKEA